MVTAGPIITHSHLFDRGDNFFFLVGDKWRLLLRLNDEYSHPSKSIDFLKRFFAMAIRYIKKYDFSQTCSVNGSAFSINNACRIFPRKRFVFAFTSSNLAWSFRVLQFSFLCVWLTKIFSLFENALIPILQFLHVESPSVEFLLCFVELFLRKNEVLLTKPLIAL